MLKQIRIGVFETNSSSTHAVAIISDDEYKQYQSGELRLSRHGELISVEEYQKERRQQRELARKKFESSENLKTSYGGDFDEYWKRVNTSYMYEYDENKMVVEHTEKVINGEKVHAISVYGYDY